MGLPPILNSLLSEGQSKLRGAFEPEMYGLSHRFVVAIDNQAYNFGSWAKVTGLSVKWDVCEYRTGDAGNAVWVAPGLTRYERIKLSRAVCLDSIVVQQWLEQTSKYVKPLSGSIQLLAAPPAGLNLPFGLSIPIVTWSLKEFFPVGWSVTDLQTAGSASVLIETLELAHNGFLGDETEV
jgi:phage tail-like protein